MGSQDRDKSRFDELEILKEIIRSNPNLYDKVLSRMRQLRHEIKLSLNDYVRETESGGSTDHLDARKRDYNK